jgi:hypothetical protein
MARLHREEVWTRSEQRLHPSAIRQPQLQGERKKTPRFRKLCGDTHWLRVREWFSRAERELSNK